MLQYKNRKLSLQHKGRIEQTLSLSGLLSQPDPSIQPDLKNYLKQEETCRIILSLFEDFVFPKLFLKIISSLFLKIYISFINELPAPACTHPNLPATPSLLPDGRGNKTLAKTNPTPPPPLPQSIPLKKERKKSNNPAFS